MARNHIRNALGSLERRSLHPNFFIGRVLWARQPNARIRTLRCILQRTYDMEV
jgi:hypothetical protein